MALIDELTLIPSSLQSKERWEVDFDTYAKEASEETLLPFSLIKAVASHETGGTYNPAAKAKTSSAFGPMQIIKGTAKELGIDRTDPRENVLGGARYLKSLLDKYDGDEEKAMAAYFKGSAVVDKYKKVKDIPGTTGGRTAHSYVSDIKRRRAEFEAKYPDLAELSLVTGPEVAPTPETTPAQPEVDMDTLSLVPGTEQPLTAAEEFRTQYGPEAQPGRRGQFQETKLAEPPGFVPPTKTAPGVEKTFFTKLKEAAQASVVDFSSAVTQLRAGQKRFDIETGKKELARLDKEREDALKKPPEERSKFDNFLIENKIGKQIQQQMLEDEQGAKYLTAVASELKKTISPEVRTETAEAQEFLSEGTVKEIAQRAIKNPGKFAESLFVTASNQAGLMLTAALPGGQAVMVAEETGRFEQDLSEDAKNKGIELDPEILAKYSSMFGVPSGLIETYTNRLLLSPGKVPGIKQLLDKAKGSVIGRLAGVAGVSTIGALSEGGEEWGQGKLEDVLGAHVYFDMAVQAENEALKQGLTRSGKAEELKALGEAKIMESKNIEKQRKNFILGTMLGAFFGAGGAIKEVSKAVKEPAPKSEQVEMFSSEPTNEFDKAKELVKEKTVDKESVTPEVEEEINKVSEEVSEPRKIVLGGRDKTTNLSTVADRIQKRNPKMPREDALVAADEGSLNNKSLRPSEVHMNSFLEKPVKEGRWRVAVFYDMDEFKRYNDKFGQAAGDRIIKGLQQDIGENSDNAGYNQFHIGGDEGVILGDLTEQEIPVFLDKLEEIKQRVNDTRIIDEKGQEIPISLSMGVKIGDVDVAEKILKEGKKKQKNTINLDSEIKKTYNREDVVGEDIIPQLEKFGLTRTRAEDVEQRPKDKMEVSGRDRRRPGGIEKKIPPGIKKPPGKEVPVPKGPIGKEQEVIGLNKREQDRVRKAIGATPLTPVERKGFNQSLTEAKTQKADESALSVADEVIRNKRMISDVEHAGMVLKAANLMDEYNTTSETISKLQNKGDKKSVQVEIARREVLADQIDRLTSASRMGRREVARALSIGRMAINMQTYDLASVTRDARAAKGAPLTEKETNRLKTLTDEYKGLEEKYNALNEKYQQEKTERDRLIAQEIAFATVGKTRIKKTPFVKIMDERAQIEKELASLGFRMNEVSGLTAEGSYLIGRLAINHIKEMAATVKGKIEMAEVVKKVKQKVPDVSEADIYQALIAKDPKRQAKARTNAVKQIARLKTQAKLMVDIDNAAKRMFAETKKKPTEDSEIKSLRTKLRDLRSQIYESGLQAKQLENAITSINWLQDQLDNQHRALKKRQRVPSESLADARQRMKDLRRAMKVEDDIADLEEQLKTGDFKIVEKPPPRRLPLSLEIAEITLARKRREVRTAIGTMNTSVAKKILNEVTGLPRALQSTGDMSGWLRQNVVPVFSHPVKAAKLIPSTTKAFFSEYQAEKVDQEIKNSPNFYLYDKSGLEIREMDSTPSKREESFQSNIAERIPIFGRVVRASNRNMVTLGNLIRSTLFEDFLVKNPNATHEELSAYADMLNITTGIGNLVKFSVVADSLSLGLYAPKLAVSRFQTPYLLLKYWKLPRVRKQYARDLAGFIITGNVILGLASMMGGDDDDIDVGSDPRSPDFGKIRVGNTRFDVWGGFQQPARLLSRIMIGATDKSGITGRGLPEDKKDVDPLELIGRFAAFKLSPWITAAQTLYTGRTPVGEEVTPTEAMAKTFTALTIQDVFETFKDAGPKRASMAAAAAWLGIGVNTYKSSSGFGKPTSRERIRRKNRRKPRS